MLNSLILQLNQLITEKSSQESSIVNPDHPALKRINAQIESVKKSLLIVEDSRPDRLRFRSIFEMKGLDFQFAWDAEKQKVPDADEIIKRIYHKPPTDLLLDMAWTTDDDILCQELLFRDKGEIKEIIKKREEDSDKKKWISGFMLLEGMRKEHEGLIKNNTLRIIVTTQYMPAVAHGLNLAHILLKA